MMRLAATSSAMRIRPCIPKTAASCTDYNGRSPLRFVSRVLPRKLRIPFPDSCNMPEGLGLFVGKPPGSGDNGQGREKRMKNRQESAESLALQGLAWLAGQDEAFGAFLAQSGS